MIEPNLHYKLTRIKWRVFAETRVGQKHDRF